MTEGIDREKYEELKRCFQFLCDRFQWSIGFKKTSLNGNLTISPRVKFRKNMDKSWKEYVRLTNSSYFMYCPSIKSICPYKKRGTRFLNFDSVIAVDRHLHFPGDIQLGDLLTNETSMRRDFIKDHLMRCDAIQNVAVDSASIGEDDQELAKYRLLQDLKHLITREFNVIFTKSTMSLKCDKIYLEYLSAPIPKFNTLEELRIKMDLSPIETITREFKVVD